jgi:DNA invertase Pin-like site-specific DNA recombinase
MARGHWGSDADKSRHLLHIIKMIDEAGASFRSVTEHIDTTMPAGRMMMQMVGAFAEFERAIIRERTSAGLAAARAEGRIGGRRKRLDDVKRREIAEAVISGRRTAAQMGGCSVCLRWRCLASSPLMRLTRHDGPTRSKLR